MDKSRGEKLSVDVDITFPRVPCYLLSIDVMDISGEHLDDVKHDIKRTRLNHSGEVVIEAKGGERPRAADERPRAEFHSFDSPIPLLFHATIGLKGEADRLAALRGKGFCGSCYGGEPPAGGCCNTCEEVRESYGKKGWSFSDPDHIDQVREDRSDAAQDQVPLTMN